MLRFRRTPLLLAGGFLVFAGTRQVRAQTSPFETTRIAEGVYQFRWQAHNGFFVVTPGGVVAIDPISTEAAARYAAEIQRVAPGRALEAVVYSHDHADHATGAHALIRAMGRQPADVPIIAHEAASPKIRAAGSADLPEPTVTFSERLTLRPGGRMIEFHWLGRSHSDNMLVAYVPDVKVAFAVDFVSNDRVGFQDLPDYHFPDFFTTLGRVLELDFDTMVYGHGPPGDRASVQRQIRYYDELRAAVRRGVDAGWTEAQTMERVRLPEYAGWQQYEVWLPLNARALFRWMAEAAPE